MGSLSMLKHWNLRSSMSWEPTTLTSWVGQPADAVNSQGEFLTKSNLTVLSHLNQLPISILLSISAHCHLSQSKPFFQRLQSYLTQLPSLTIKSSLYSLIKSSSPIVSWCLSHAVTDPQQTAQVWVWAPLCHLVVIHSLSSWHWWRLKTTTSVRTCFFLGPDLSWSSLFVFFLKLGKLGCFGLYLK